MTKHKKLAKHQLQKTVTKEPKIAFDSNEFPHHIKNELWYIGIGLLLLVGVLASISTRNYLFALVIVAGGLAIFRLAPLRPKTRKIEITPRGIGWGEQFWGYHQLKSFWAAEVNGTVTVYLERLNLASLIHFDVPDDRVDDVLVVLSLELPFHAHKNEPVPDRLARLLRI